MKVYYLILGAFLTFMTIMFMRCEKPTEVTELVNNTEKVQVVFYNGEAPDTFVEITDRNEIKDFNDYISSDDTPLRKCGYDGQIIFFLFPDVAAGSGNSVAMEFSLQPDCEHVEYKFADALQTKAITSEGMEYLHSIAK